MRRLTGGVVIRGRQTQLGPTPHPHPPLKSEKPDFRGDGSIFRFNTAWLYRPERDADNDGIMCKNYFTEGRGTVLGENRCR